MAFPCLQQCIAVHFRHKKIGHHEIRCGLFGFFESLTAVSGQIDKVTVGLKQRLQIVLIVGMVIHNKHTAGHAAPPRETSLWGTGQYASTSLTKVSGSIGFSM